MSFDILDSSLDFEGSSGFESRAKLVVLFLGESPYRQRFESFHFQMEM